MQIESLNYSLLSDRDFDQNGTTEGSEDVVTTWGINYFGYFMTDLKVLEDFVDI